ncbi:unnamed protein product [Paramecium octaurelia]|uniref:WD domain, G-beta repeat protein n=1 Tax=Paramecium octaurelia TaxID=43137 RepID=A0A8S1UJ13_PAROT|nr:unnamed protein product [Paramecium octaurelia]
MYSKQKQLPEINTLFESNRDMNKDIGIITDSRQQKIIEDSFLINTSDSLNVKSLETNLRVPILNLPQTKFENSNLAQYLFQNIQPQMQCNTNNQIYFKDQLLNEKQINQETQSFANKQNLQPFTYQLIQQYSISKRKYCCAIAINQDCSILLAGCGNQIKVFDFNQGIIKINQILQEHKDRVFTLNFMKKSCSFISGACDNTIIIWQQSQNNQWISQQILNGHTSYIFCLILNNNEDLIVSGSWDNTIKFWVKNNQWSCHQTIEDHTSDVYGVSFNQQQNRIVSCGSDNLILIMELQGEHKEWIIIQKISVEQYGYRVCFIDNNMFALSIYDKEQISIFEMNSVNRQFTKTRDIHVKCESDGNCLFPSQYIMSKSLLFSKNGQCVNVIKKTLNGEFVTEQSIQFYTPSIFGVINDDGEYLITWDANSNQIQIRRYQEF